MHVVGWVRVGGLGAAMLLGCCMCILCSDTQAGVQAQAMQTCSRPSWGAAGVLTSTVSKSRAEVRCSRQGSLVAKQHTGQDARAGAAEDGGRG